MSAYINHQLVGRKLTFDFSATPKYWVPDDAFTTHIYNSMHLLLPAVEHWFCRLANQTLPYVTDENLRADIKGFIAQEAAHANAHKIAAQYFDAHDMDPEPFKERMEWMFKNLLNDTPLGLKWPFNLFKRQWLGYRMGIIAALEHYFCFFGTWVLDAQGLDDAGADPAMLDLIRWHGAEEVEHRTVGFDAYRALAGDGFGGYLGRQAAMAAALPAIAIFWTAATIYLGKIDGSDAARQVFKKSLPALFLQFQMTASHKGHLPRLAIIVETLADWIKPSHHPEHDGDVEAALRYIANSAAAQMVKAAGPSNRKEP